MSTRRVLVCIGLIGIGPLFAEPACESLATLPLPNTVIIAAASVPAGTFTALDGTVVPGVPAFCRVAGSIQPTGDSDIHFEVWMPSSGWNGKFAGVDNGGYAGSINYAGMGGALSQNYAVASTDTGHEAFVVDASWALGHPEKIIDFGYRAIHETTEQSKALVAAFYGEGPSHSFFVGCSNGGREALMEAQRYPDDYDGILAGAPANFWTHLMSGAVWGAQALTQNSASYIPAFKLPAIDAAVLQECDAVDGLADGLIEDPRKCDFDPSILLCQGAETDSCLTAPQVDTLRKLYTGPRDSYGAQIFPGYLPGGQSGPNGWSLWVTGPLPGTSAMYYFGTEFFQDMVYNDASWNYLTFDLDRDASAADRAMAAILNATDPDLRAFRNRGGKLILFHGWSDPAIPTFNTINYYQNVLARMGRMSATSFVRLYLAPGMQHCTGGAGPDSFGQGGFAQGDPQDDMEAALERWVEQGTPPGKIIATQYNTDSEPASGVKRTRPLCPFPEVARYLGQGSPDDATSFVCSGPTVRGGPR